MRIKHDSQTVRNNSRQSGFTLIEVIITMFIMAVGMMALTSMQITSINGNIDARMRTQANTLAADTMEKLMALPYDDPVLDPDAGQFSRAETDYTIFWQTVENVDPADTKTIIASVTWLSGGEKKTTTFSYLKALEESD